MKLEESIKKLSGPILVLGASGFIGSNLFRELLKYRSDVFGTSSRLPNWRLDGIDNKHLFAGDLRIKANLEKLLKDVQPKTIFSCLSFGGYHFQTNVDLIFQTNTLVLANLIELIKKYPISALVHAGSSSEYGKNAKEPLESQSLSANSYYSASKISASSLIDYAGQQLHIPCANLRLFSVYGTYEDSSRLIPQLIIKGEKGQLPDFVSPDISRDFVYIDDVCAAFVQTALAISPEFYGHSFNIGTGVKTTIAEIASQSKQIFNIADEPSYQMSQRSWDISEWYANIEKSSRVLGWKAQTSLNEGLKKTLQWYRSLSSKEEYQAASKQFQIDTTHSLSIIIACYKDEPAVIEMYERLTKALEPLHIDYEIIYVNDASPDQAESRIVELSTRDYRVKGITHSRNFGSQAAFKSGMAMSRKNAVVLMDGDLQDPPELIPAFIEKWKEGYNVVFGRRVNRETTWFMGLMYKLFYRLFDWFSYLKIPHDAGDFSLMDRDVVSCLLQFDERDLFWRGIRAYVGFKQTGVDYVRPARKYGLTTNSLTRYIGWAKRGIISFSNSPLSILSSTGFILLVLSFFLLVAQIVARIVFPSLVPEGFTTLICLVVFFGSLNLFAVAIIGEYIAKIFDEVKRRPHYFPTHFIQHGEKQRWQSFAKKE